MYNKPCELKVNSNGLNWILYAIHNVTYKVKSNVLSNFQPAQTGN